jgi:hypothetical protein
MQMREGVERQQIPIVTTEGLVRKPSRVLFHRDIECAGTAHGRDANNVNRYTSNRRRNKALRAA